MKNTWSSIIAAGLILATPTAFGEDPKPAPTAKDAKIPALTVAASANTASPAAKEAVKDVAKGPGGAASASASAAGSAAPAAGKTPKEVAKEVAAKADAVSKDVGNSLKEAAAVKDLAAKQANAAAAKDAKAVDAKDAKAPATDAKDAPAKDAQTKAVAAPKREPIRIDAAKEAQRQREYERARNYAHGITTTPKATTTDSRNTEAQLRTIIAAQQEELEYLRSIAHDVRVIKHSTAVSGYSYP